MSRMGERLILLAMPSIHAGAWRYPGADPGFQASFEQMAWFARTLEQGCFDGLFLPDTLAARAAPIETLVRGHSIVTLDPLTLLPALAAVTQHIGLIGTASTTYNEPYMLARRLASLDVISGGRAGWNLVTSSNPNEAANFGAEQHMEHGARYRRAREFCTVMDGLWESWDQDAFCRDADSGLYFDAEKMHVLDHHGPHFSVRGPLNVERPVQSRPVVVQAGASEAGRQIAAETAEVIFTYQTDKESAQQFYAEMQCRARAAGRQQALKIIPAVFVVWGETLAQAQEKRRRLDLLVDDASSLATLSIALGHDISHYDPHGPLPDIPESNASKSGRERVIRLARSEDLSIIALARRICGYQGLEMVGTAEMIADQMQLWLECGAADGFNIMFSHLPGGATEFVAQVVPELQQRGLLRLQYEGNTFRDNLGLRTPGPGYSRG
ncbi:LLM class flavin-dependent oxidoreductase [Oceanimonas baumannii]|uniref:FMN-dependent oxidoreductase (Nitrilotriacetate monooxygenase family) n=1 Tax=Oceanimonas baumannii TaxID=129578 RepID=A0A235CHY8_9GAMM|nr:LLM class flavin-dependent oxidoreductase [Oceanimonas baumannii]OYD23994.1 LLM class flavin-dependent oxidoreductase [Oceanimonas baumannii]TDW58670.1 FMN-dependent oxidoreductase (nitrilotriacetate monooxygenase family) [Oceanimonas baumannii]